VTLIERASHLGGQVRDAARAPGRSELLQIVEWLGGQCRQVGVDLRLETEVTPDLVRSLAPDVVVVATGSTMNSRTPEGNMTVHSIQDALTQRVPQGSRIVVVDDFGDWQGFAVALALAERRIQVEFVTPTQFPGYAIELTNWRIAYERLVSMGVKFHPVMTLASAGDRSVRLRSAYGKVEEVLGDIDALVSVPMPTARDELYHALVGTVEALHLAGDARAPRGIEASVYDGHAIARDI
jgi:2,4-dienoyl-CoA reductase (NADPH2)